MDKHSAKMTHLAAFIIITMLVGFVQVSVVFSEPISVVVNGRTLQTDVPPTIIQGITMVPFRSVFEASGAVVQWDHSTKTVTGTNNSTIVQLRIGSQIVDINGVPTVIEVPGTIIGGRTMVPALLISKSLEADVKWVEETQTVAINHSMTTESVTVDQPEIPAGTVFSSLEQEIVQAYLFAYSLEKQLWNRTEVFETKEAVFQFMQQGFSDDFAWDLADYYWTEPEGLLGLGAYLIVPEHTVHVLEIDLENNEATLWHETDQWERDHWQMDTYKIVTLQREDNGWKVKDQHSVGTPPA